MSFSIIGYIRGISLTLLGLTTLAFSLFFFYKSWKNVRSEKSVDLRFIYLGLGFLGISGSYWGGMGNFLLILFTGTQLPLDLQMRIYVWGPLCGAFFFVLFAISFLTNRLRWLLPVFCGFTSIAFILIFYPNPRKYATEISADGIRETILLGIPLILLIITIVTAILSIILIFGYTAIKTPDIRIKARSYFISIGGTLYAISGILDFSIISASTDITVVIIGRLFSLMTITILFLGFHYPYSLEKRLLSFFYSKTVTPQIS